LSSLPAITSLFLALGLAAASAAEPQRPASRKITRLNAANGGVSIFNSTVTEGNAGQRQMFFPLEMPFASEVPVSVDYFSEPGTATPGVDYEPVQGTVVFQPGSTFAEIVVTINGDLAVEGNETFFIILFNPTNTTIAQGQATGTIMDDDLTRNLIVNTETNALVLAEVVTGGGASGLVVRDARLMGHANFDGASSGLYYLTNEPPYPYGLSQPGVVISSGNVLSYQSGPNSRSGFTTDFATSATPEQEALLDPITGDQTNNWSHYDVTQLDIVFDVQPGSNYVTFTVVFGSEEYPEYVNSRFIDGFGIYLNGTNIALASGLPVNINHPDMRHMEGTELDGVLAPGGVATLQFSALVPSGSTGNTLTFIVADTSDAVLDTTVYVSSLRSTAPPTPLQVSPATVTEGHSGFINAQFEVSLAYASTQTVYVSYSTMDGTANAGSDYVATNGLLVFEPGQTRQYINVPVIGDTLFESDEVFFIRISNPINASYAGGLVPGTIIDDENVPCCGPYPSVSFVSSPIVAEGDYGTTSVVFTVQLSCTSGPPVYVRYNTANGTALAEGDFLPVSGTLVFLPGEIEKKVTVTVLNDLLNEDNETFQLRLSNPSNALLAVSSGTATILDNDPLPSLSITNAGMVEGNVGTNNLNFSVRLSEPSGRQVRVSYATSGGSATAGTDFLARNGLLTFAPGVTQVSLPVPVIGDVQIEGDEYFQVNLSNPNNASLLNASAQGVITNDDGFPGEVYTFLWSVIPTNVDLYAAFQVTITALDAQGNVATNFTGTVSLGAINSEGKPVAITPTATGPFVNGEWSGLVRVLETGDGIRFTASDGGGHGGGGGGGGISVKPAPSDLAITKTAGPLPAAVGVPLVYTITVSNKTAELRENVRMVDYLPNALQYLSATVSQGRFSVNANLLEADLESLAGGETAVVSITVRPNTPGAVTNVAVATHGFGGDLLVAGLEQPIESTPATAVLVTLVSPPAFSSENTAIREGDTGKVNAAFTVWLSTPINVKTSVKYATADLTAHAGLDYTARSGLITLLPGESSKTVSIPILPNLVGQPDRQFLVNFSGPVNSSLATTQIVVTILDDDLAPAGYSVVQENCLSLPPYSTNPPPEWPYTNYPPYQTPGEPPFHLVGNHAVDPGETVTVEFCLRNPGPLPTTNLIATLLATGGVSQPGGQVEFGVIEPGQTVCRPFTFTALGACAGKLTPHLLLQDGAVNRGVAKFDMILGVPFRTTNHFQNANALTVSKVGSASPYPSTINVAGITGTVSKVTVTLSNLWHGNPDFLDVMLIGPSGAATLLMSDAGGSTDVTNLVVTFDDDALIPVPDSTALASGRYQPANYEKTADVFVTPTPVENLATNLGVFQAQPANGTWQLLVMSDGAGAGAILNGWTLSIETLDANCCNISAEADLGVKKTTSQTNAVVGGSLTYDLVVTNRGPNAAYGVTLYDTLPPGASLLSVWPEQLDYSVEGRLVIIGLGDLTNRGSVSLRLVIQPGQAGSATNSVYVYGQQPDYNPFNNESQVVTPVGYPALQVSGLSLAEGHQGYTPARIPLTLASANVNGVQVTFQTTNGTALANSDYVPASGTLYLPPGQTTGSVEILIVGDTVPEADEVFYVNLQAQGAVLSANRATVTIVNDDDLPQLYFTHGEVTEGDQGQTNGILFVHLSRPGSQPVTVEFYTISGSASEGEDYQFKKGVLIIPAGETNQCIAVPVNGDTQVESDEVFYVGLLNPVNAVIGQPDRGVITIRNDDGLPGQLYRFVWSPIAFTQQVNHPFGVTLTALDYFGNVATDFQGVADLFGYGSQATAPAPVIGQPASGGFLSGNFSVGYVFRPLTNITVTHVMNLGGTVVSLWTDAGQLLSSVSVPSSGQWARTALPQAVVLQAGQRYRISVFSGNTRMYYGNQLSYGSGAVAIVQHLFGAGSGLPQSSFNKQPLVDFEYQAVGPEAPLPISPTTTGNFINGVWSGYVSVQQPAALARLLAVGRQGHSGQSGYFLVAGYMPDLALAVKLVLGGQGELQALGAGAGRLLKVTCNARKPFVLEASTDLKHWLPVLTSQQPEAVIEHTEDATTGLRFFRARSLP